MDGVLDEDHKCDAVFWRGVLAKARHIDDSKLLLLIARQKIDQWCAVYGGLTPSELQALLEDVKGIIYQGRDHQGVIRKRPRQDSAGPHLRVVK